jgi:hypothetical protein
VQDIQQLSTVTGLTQVLAFADAVGSRSGLGKALCSQLQQLKSVVQLPEQVLELPLPGYTYWFNALQLCHSKLRTLSEVGSPLSSAEQRVDVQQQVAKQLSALLRLAHVVSLQPLLDVLHQFLLLNVRPGQYFLSSVANLVFSDAVLEAALGSSSSSSSSILSKEAYVSSALAHPCSLTPGKIGHSSLLKPVGPRAYDTSTDVLRFDAELLRDFAGGRAGDTVKVTLDLFGGESLSGQGLIQLKNGASPGSMSLPAQLLLGCTFTDAAALQEFLGANPAV